MVIAPFAGGLMKHVPNERKEKGLKFALNSEFKVIFSLKNFKTKIGVFVGFECTQKTFLIFCRTNSHMQRKFRAVPS